MKARGQYRNVMFTDALKKVYMDDAGSFLFKGLILSEIIFANFTANVSQSALKEEKPGSWSSQESFKDILRHFLLKKFSKKCNVKSWCEKFEKKSICIGLSGQKQIEILKNCLNPSLDDWFLVNLTRLPAGAEWPLWKAQLLKTFGDHTFQPVKCTFTFKFLNGSLIDYAIKKEKMLLDLKLGLTNNFILYVYLIGIGLPNHVQNSLNRLTVDSLEKSRKILKKFDAGDKT